MLYLRQYNSQQYNMNDQAQIITALKKLNFTDKESAIYLELLKLGSAPASILALKTKIPRPTAKFTCEQLMKRNVINSLQKGNAVIYSIDTPEKLLFILDQKEEELDEQRSEINRLMSTLKALKNPHSILPKVQYFEGLDAVSEAFVRCSDEIPASGELLSFASSQDITPGLSEEDKEKVLDASTRQIQRRIERNIKARLIATNSQRAKLIQKNDKVCLRETRFIAPEYSLFSFGEIMIYDDTIFAVSIEENVAFAVKIENYTLTAMYKALFESTWAHATKDAKTMHKK